MPANLYLLRHAQGWHNDPGPNYVGDSYNDPQFRDAVLTPVGLEQTVAKRLELATTVFDAIYCSPMRRCRQTLLGVYPKAVDMNVHLDDRLIEQPTGKNIADYRLERDLIINTCPKKWDGTGVAVINPFNISSDSLDQQKIRNMTQHILKKHVTGNVLIVTHGAWIGRWLEMYQGHTYYIDNCHYVIATLEPNDL